MCSSMNVIQMQQKCQVNSVAEDSVLLGYDTLSLGNHILTFQGNIVASSSKVKILLGHFDP
jgi:hypothetical protein